MGLSGCPCIQTCNLFCPSYSTHSPISVKQGGCPAVEHPPQTFSSSPVRWGNQCIRVRVFTQETGEAAMLPTGLAEPRPLGAKGSRTGQLQSQHSALISSAHFILNTSYSRNICKEEKITNILVHLHKASSLNFFFHLDKFTESVILCLPPNRKPVLFLMVV